MKLEWIRENPPRWDQTKDAIIGGAPEGAFDLASQEDGDLLSGEWWHVEEDGIVVGYGWMDTTWGDAEILLAVAPDRQRQGIGNFILEKLEDEAHAAGLNYMYNAIRDENPLREQVAAWLEDRDFEPSRDGRHMRRVQA